MDDLIIEFPDGAYRNIDAVEKVIHYIMRLGNMKLVGGCGINLTNADDIAEQFYRVKEFYNKNHGKQILHIIFTVGRKTYLNAMQVKKLGWLLSMYFGVDRQVLFAVHDDTDNLHIHMAINTVAFTNGASCTYFDMNQLKKYANKCLSQIMSEVYMKENIDLMQCVI